MTSQTWIVVADNPAISQLISTARSIGERVVVVTTGSRETAEALSTADIDRLVWLGGSETAPPEAYAGAVAGILAQDQPRAVLAADRAADRILLGAVAARLRISISAGISGVTVDGDDIVVSRTVFGGIAIQEVIAPVPSALIIDGGSTPEAVSKVEIEEGPASPYEVEIISVVPSGAEQVDLKAANRVVGIGRGLKAQKDLELVESLASALGAEVACTRPLAEGSDWLPKDRYIGISGQSIAPSLYVAAGISGQLQHVVGVAKAGMIVAINTDATAPIFAVADYGVVGDLYEIVPAIVAVLQGEAKES